MALFLKRAYSITQNTNKQEGVVLCNLITSFGGHHRHQKVWLMAHTTHQADDDQQASKQQGHQWMRMKFSPLQMQKHIFTTDATC